MSIDNISWIKNIYKKIPFGYRSKAVEQYKLHQDQRKFCYNNQEHKGAQGTSTMNHMGEFDA